MIFLDLAVKVLVLLTKLSESFNQSFQYHRLNQNLNKSEENTETDKRGTKTGSSSIRLNSSITAGRFDGLVFTDGAEQPTETSGSNSLCPLCLLLEELMFYPGCKSKKSKSKLERHQLIQTDLLEAVTFLKSSPTHLIKK